MMDISDATRSSVVERGGLKINARCEAEGGGADEPVEDGRFWSPSDDGLSQKLKRSFDDELTNSKKRRKQLKPIKIATNLDEMVKVPKQIIGLNNDLGDVDDFSHAVPNRLSPLLTDVHSKYSPRSETPAGEKGNQSSATTSETSRIADNLELNDLNVPSIEMGPNYIANPHFMFPLSFSPMKTAAFWSEANLKIFNQEAYCELCKKEFCNKYFLKTHKANKHGIYADMSAGKLSGKFDCKDAGPPPVVRTHENGKVQGDGECAYCDLCNKRFCNKYFLKRHKTKSHGLPEEDGPPTFPSQETEMTIVQTSTNHSTKETDNLTLETPEPLALVSKENELDNQKRDRRETEGEEDEQEKEEDEEEEEEGPLNLIVNSKESGDEETKPEDDPQNEGDDCSSENIEKLQTMLLRLNPSEIDLKTCTTCNEGDPQYKCRQEKKEKEYLSEVNDSSNESKPELGGIRLDGQDFYASKLDHPKQMKPTSSYCEICNKELCNKYFMKTHMQRMHGIEIEHGTQIGGVICNICNKELCSKYFLRVHKQNTHGITSPTALMGPSTSGNTSGQKPDVKTPRPDARFPSNFTQVCYICNKRFRNPKWLQAHFLSDHADEVSKIDSKDLEEGNGDDESSFKPTRTHSKTPKDATATDLFGTSFGLLENPAESLDVISKIFWENSVPTKLFNCSQCSFTTSVLAFLFVHERSHFVLAQDQPEVVKPSVSLQNLIHDKTFWQHKITQQIPECLDLSPEKPNYVSLEQNGS